VIICVVDDLMFATKISTAAKAVRAQVRFERVPGNVLPRIRAERPALVIFDLNSARLQPIDTIAAIKRDADVSGTRTLGYVSHVQSDVIAAARAAGCDEVLARSAFSEKLGDILTRTT
jgi:DNA-binding NarL/FixJ family response regulator